MEHVVRLRERSDGLHWDFGLPGLSPAVVPVAAPDLRRARSRTETVYDIAPDGEDGPGRAELLRLLGHDLYRLVDGRARHLSVFLRRHWRADWRLAVLAVDVSEGLRHLPWELLHDGHEYLVTADRPLLPVRVVPVDAEPLEPRSRPLRVLFMACSPTGDGRAPLDYRAEEAAIDGAAHADGIPVNLEYEPFGVLGELERRLARQGQQDPFDVVHVTGHAGLADHEPYFLTEGPRGRPVRSSTSDLRDALDAGRPQLLFLSGCRTAQSDGLGVAPSLAERLAAVSARVVIGWGRPVRDPVATEATGDFYRELIRGCSPSWALRVTYRRLKRSGRSQWHCLRMFAQHSPPGPLVTAMRDMPSDEILYERRPLGPHGLPRFPVGMFVGRREEWQLLNRHLDIERNVDRPGVIVHGLGGTGKTTLLSRFLDSLPAERVVFVPVSGRLDAQVLENRMRADPRLANLLESFAGEKDLGRRLAHVLGEIDRPVLFVLDEFEKDNLETDGAQVLPVPEAAEVCAALIGAVTTVQRRHRIAITSRYLPVMQGIEELAELELHGLPDQYVNHLINRLQARSAVPLDTGRIVTIRKHASGNPRLLDWLFGVAGRNPALQETLLAHDLEEKRAEFYDDLVVTRLVERQDPQDAALIRALIPFTVAVPVDVLARLGGPSALRAAPSVPGPLLEETITRARRLTAWHLLEETTGGAVPPDTPGPRAARYRVPTVLRGHLQSLAPDGVPDRCLTALASSLDIERENLDPTLVEGELLRELYRLAVAAGQDEIVVRSARALTCAASTRFRYHEAGEISRRALDIVPDPLLYAALGAAEAEQGNSTAARRAFDRAAELLPASLPDRDQAQVHAILAFWAQYRDPQSVEHHIDAAMRLARAAADAATQAFCLRMVACATAREPGRNARARAATLFEESLSLLRSLPGTEPAQLALALDRISFLNVPGSAEEQWAARHELLVLLESCRQRTGRGMQEAAVRIRLATVHRLLGVLDRATKEAEASGTIARELGWTRGVVDSLLERALVLSYAWDTTLNPEDAGLDAADLERAIDLVTEADSLTERMGWPGLRIRTLSQLRRLYRQTHRQQDAARADAEYEALSVELSEVPKAQAERLLLDAEQARDGHHEDEAVELAGRVLPLLGTGQGHKALEVQARRMIAEIRDGREDPSADLDPHLRRLLHLYQDLDPTALPLVHFWRGRMFLREARPGAARAELTQAVHGYRDNGEALAACFELLGSMGDVSRDVRAAHLGRAAAARHRSGETESVVADLVTMADLLPERDRPEPLRAAAALARACDHALGRSQALERLAGLLPEPQAARTQEEAEALRRSGEPLNLAVGTSLASLLDPDDGGQVLDEITHRRAELREQGITLPTVRVYDDPSLDPLGYIVYLWGVPMVSARVRPPRRSRRQAVARAVTVDVMGVARTHPDRLEAPARRPRDLTDEDRRLLDAVLDRCDSPWDGADQDPAPDTDRG